MSEEPTNLQESEDPIYSDFDRFGLLLSEAQSLAKENNNYNPATIREYFSALKEIWRFLEPMTKGRELHTQIKMEIVELDTVTRASYNLLLTTTDFKVPLKIFDSLSELHTKLLQLKQDIKLGIKIREKLTGIKKLENALE
jgi:hypothetical protein